MEKYRDIKLNRIEKSLKRITNMTKIAQYNPRFFPIVGGGETHVSNLVNGMKDYNFEIITNALKNSPLNEQFSDNTLIRRFLPYDMSLIPFENSVISKYSFPYRLMTDVLRIWRKNKYLESSDCALVHFHGIGFGNNLLRADKLLNSSFLMKLIDFSSINKPKILTMHNLFSAFSDKPIYEKYEHFIIDQFENIICVDRNIENYVNDYVNSTNQHKNVWFIPNSVDIDKFHFSKIEQKDKIRIGFVGRFEHSRGIDLLRKLIENIPDFCELHITSNPIEGNNNSNIHCHGVLQENEVPHFLENIDILFNPVLAQGISRISLEAMSCGRPAIMLDIGDRYPIIHDKTGYLIDGEIGELISLLEHIHENMGELNKLGENSRMIVENEFSNEVIIPKIKQIYEDLVHEN